MLKAKLKVKLKIMFERQLLHRLSLLALIIVPAIASADIAVNPTATDELPAAIVGFGGGLRGTDLSYFDGNPAAKGYLAVPASTNDTPRGAVILIHEWDGLTERVRQTADAFAAEGYVALAADLYGGKTGSNREENMVLVNASLADMPQIVSNLDAAANYLKGRADVNGKVATIGWCYGGGVALSFAMGNDNHEGTAIFYGRLLDDPEAMQHIHHEVYGTFAGQDKGIPPAKVDAFVAAMRKAGIPNDVHIYDEVNHGFWLHVDRDPNVNQGPALDAWQRLKGYLQRTVGSAAAGTAPADSATPM